ncbi:uncharacterized protein LOC126281637 [Schistocerca gregaria]|uniref:uncharacterized protein LOC126281637 n=1 Tax=Schistocerca gregaria TaxID=7010 RepID=UPI00211DBAAE|nr:uncharacterized protein LOC126281637 [Schistocerca gregaria]
MLQVADRVMVSLWLLVLMSRGTPLYAALWTKSAPGGAGKENSARSPLTVAQCRATCLREFSEHLSTDSTCMLTSDCITCWQTCDVLQSGWSVWGSICSGKTICPAGCRAACHFLASSRGGTPAPQPVLETRAAARLETHGLQLQWPCSGRHPVVHVVLWRPRGRDQWAQLTQTADCWARLPSAGSARVLAVGPSGLQAVYTPVAASGAAPSDHGLAAEEGADAEAEDEAEGPGWKTRTVNGSQWSLRLTSVIHQGALVIAELSWRLPEKELQAARSDGGSPLYLVTWEVDGGGITGNLYTDSSCVTLSLSSDTVFHIQVELVTKRADKLVRSPPLVVDTGGGEDGTTLVLVAPAEHTGRALAGLQGWRDTMRFSLVLLLGLCLPAAFVATIICLHSYRRQRLAAQARDKLPLF